MSSILTIILAIILFMMVILIHELGHFCCAKYLGVAVYELAVGVGPMVRQSEKNGTKYSLRLIPFGGYCDMDGTKMEVVEGKLDEDGEPEMEVRMIKNDDPCNYNNQPAWVKLLILSAGPVFNFLFAIIVMSLTLAIFTDQFTLSAALMDSFSMVGAYFVIIWQTIADLFVGRSGAAEFVGVVGMVDVIAEEASFGLPNLIYFMGSISINLGIMNLIPIPALDGGRIVLTLLRKLTGNRISDELESKINTFGVLIIFILMIFLIIKDIIHLI